MPRLKRFDYLYDGCIVHVRLQVNNGEFLFQKAIHYKLWKKWVKYYLRKYPSVKLTGYQWMSNHCHMMLEAESARDLTKFLHDINWRFAFEFNKLTKRKGHFFQSRYRCSVIDKDEYEVICQRYMYRNQLRAGMVRHVKHSRFGSYHHYAYGKANELITPFRNYANFGKDLCKRRQKFRMFVEVITDREKTNEKIWKQRLSHPNLKTIAQVMKDRMRRKKSAA